MIDVHAHWAPREYARFAATRDLALPTLPGVPLDDTPSALNQRREDMERAGVSKQMLSPPAMPWLSADHATAAAAARAFNVAGAALVSQWPFLFGAYVSLPLPHIGASLAELAYGLDELGLTGVVLPTAIGSKSIADPIFESILAECNRRAAVVFVHPCVKGACSCLINNYGLTASVGPLVEDTLAAAQLIASGAILRFSQIKFIIPHLGGLMPILLERLDNQLPWAYPDLAEPPSQTARRLWYDIVSHGSKAAIACAARTLGADRLLPGSDYPFLLPFMTYKDCFDTPDEDTCRAIAHNSAVIFELQQ